MVTGKQFVNNATRSNYQRKLLKPKVNSITSSTIRVIHWVALLKKTSTIHLKKLNYETVLFGFSEMALWVV